MSRVVRTPLDPAKTEKWPSTHTGRLEIWHAESADGVWRYHRYEDGSTLWTVEHVPSGGCVWASSLRKAQIATADGSALRELLIRAGQAARAAQVRR